MKPKQRELKGTTEELDNFIIELKEAIHLAEGKHRLFPYDLIHGTGIMIEEAGETMQAAIDATYFRDCDILAVDRELMHTTAMCFRLWVSMWRQDNKPV
ncbi:hypothetical protein ES705_16425 [subsurface metagenome]